MSFISQLCQLYVTAFTLIGRLFSFLYTQARLSLSMRGLLAITPEEDTTATYPLATYPDFVDLFIDLSIDAPLAPLPALAFVAEASNAATMPSAPESVLPVPTTFPTLSALYAAPESKPTQKSTRKSKAPQRAANAQEKVCVTVAANKSVEKRCACKGKTKSGAPCKRIASEDGYCAAHRKNS